MSASLWIEAGEIRIRAPYDPDFVAWLKRIPPSERSYDPESKVWGVNAARARDVIDECRYRWPEVALLGELRDFDEPPPSGCPHLANLLTLIGRLPPAGLRRVYRVAVAAAHPDQGGDLRLCQDLTSAWRELEGAR